MAVNLRVSLTILSLGFGIEGGGELVALLSNGTFRPGANFVFVLPIVVTLAGLLFVGIGQHEWNELHRSRVRTAHRLFGLSLLAGAVGGGVVGLLLLEPAWGTPLWAQVLFGTSLGFLVLGTFATYALLVFHLVARPSKAALLASIAWACVVATMVGNVLGRHLAQVVGLATDRALVVPRFLGPVSSLVSYLFISYFLLLAVYLEAHRTVTVRQQERTSHPLRAWRGPMAPRVAPAPPVGGRAGRSVLEDAPGRRSPHLAQTPTGARARAPSAAARHRTPPPVATPIGIRHRRGVHRR